MSINSEIELLRVAWADARQLERPGQCIYCESTRIWLNGRRKRTASVLIGEQVFHLAKVVCLRVKCGGCRKSWTVRPKGLLPHKHYQPCVVAHTLQAYLFEAKATQAKVAHEFSTSERTVRRWTAWTAELATPKDCQRRLLFATDAPMLPAIPEVPQASRKARSPRRRALLVGAAMTLCLLEALVCAWGLEPPGLRSVLERVIGGRAGLCTYARPVIPEDAW